MVFDHLDLFRIYNFIYTWRPLRLCASDLFRFRQPKFNGQFQTCLFRLLQVCSLKLAYIDQAGPLLAMAFACLPRGVLSTTEMNGLD